MKINPNLVYCRIKKIGWELPEKWRSVDTIDFWTLNQKAKSLTFISSSFINVLMKSK